MTVQGKGNKVKKCSNERGITLASNAGTLFERLLNNIIKVETKMSESEAGGQQGMAIADHLVILNALINQVKKSKKK